MTKNVCHYVTVTFNSIPFLSDSSYKWLSSTFSPGEFKPFTPKPTGKTKPETSAEPEQNTEQGGMCANQSSKEIFPCPHDSCIRVFQKVGNLERHLTSEKCTRALEKHSLMDLATMGYKHELEESVGVIPTLKATPVQGEQGTVATVSEGWALRSKKKACRFNETQVSYLNAKFQIGQSTRMKVNAEAVAVEMRRAHGPDGMRLFKVSEFLSTQQITSYFSRLAAKIRKQTLSEPDLQAVEEQ